LALKIPGKLRVLEIPGMHRELIGMHWNVAIL
jgi:hypothetical protein